MMILAPKTHLHDTMDRTFCGETNTVKTPLRLTRWPEECNCSACLKAFNADEDADRDLFDYMVTFG